VSLTHSHRLALPASGVGAAGSGIMSATVGVPPAGPWTPTMSAPSRPAHYALSLKQPWAALLVHGLKSIEIRSWPTAKRERILIHAARIPDERPEAWRWVPNWMLDKARLLGGLIGEGVLTDCRAYRTREAFAADRIFHLNEDAWFNGEVMYGFTFAHLTVLPFRECKGQTRFFRVEAADGAVTG
jgi:hypothetical protein